MELADNQILEILLDMHQKLPAIQERIDQIYEQQKLLCKVPQDLALLEHRILVLEQKEENKTAVVLSTKGIILTACLAFGSSLVLAWLSHNIT